MKLFDDFEVVKFPQENLLFVTHSGYLYYIYNSKYKIWRRHKNAGNDLITVSNYQDVSEEELLEAMEGSFPQKETDFARKCAPSQICIRDMLNLLSEDYPQYMSDWMIRQVVHSFLLESDICYKSYLKLQELFNNAILSQTDNESVLCQIKDLCFTVIGRDIFKKEIRIVDGHDGSSYFWIMPARIVDYSNTDSMDNVAEMKSVEISIEEDDVAQYLTPFLYKYFDAELEANKSRVDYIWQDDGEEADKTYKSGFEWYLTYNFFTHDSIEKMLMDIRDTIDALASGRENDYTIKLREKRGWETQELLYAKNLSEEQIAEYNANRPKEDDTEIELIIDFYHRFIYRMEYMMRVAQEKGYNLISVMGP